MNRWRIELENILDIFESGRRDYRLSLLRELVVFLGESECDGVGGYMDRRDEAILAVLEKSAELIASQPLLAVCEILKEEVRQLPEGKDFFERVWTAIGEDDKDPFQGSNSALLEFLQEIEDQLDVALVKEGILDELPVVQR